MREMSGMKRERSAEGGRGKEGEGRGEGKAETPESSLRGLGGSQREIFGFRIAGVIGLERHSRMSFIFILFQ